MTKAKRPEEFARIRVESQTGRLAGRRRGREGLFGLAVAVVRITRCDFIERLTTSSFIDLFTQRLLW
jgi:hypothetical protein